MKGDCADALVLVNVFSMSLIFMLLGKESDKAHQRGNEAGSLCSVHRDKKQQGTSVQSVNIAFLSDKSATVGKCYLTSVEAIFEAVASYVYEYSWH